MSEETYGWYIETHFIAALPRTGVRIESTVYTQMPDGTWQIEDRKVRLAYSHFKHHLFTYQLSKGRKQVDFKIVEPPDAKIVPIKPIFVRSFGEYQVSGPIINASTTAPERLEFEILKGGRSLNVIKIIPASIAPPAEPEELEIEVSTTDPVTKQILDTVIGFGSSIVDAVGGLGGKLGDMASLGLSIVGGFFTSFIDFIPSIFARLQRTSGETAVRVLEEAQGHSAPHVAVIKREGNSIVEQYTKWVPKEWRSVPNYDKALHGEDAVKWLQDWKKAIWDNALNLFAVHLIGECVSLGQLEALSQIDPMILQKMGVYEVFQKATGMPIEISVLKPAEQYWNAKYTVEIPTYSDLINMRVKEKISQDEFELAIAKQGFSKYWAEKIWDAHFLPPNYQQIRDAYFRGAISHERLLALMERVDLDPEFNAEIWEPLLEQVPPYSELVNERVKEVLSQDDFNKYLRYYGFDSAWADRIWKAHFTPPTIGDFLTAWRRRDKVRVPYLNEQGERVVPSSTKTLTISDIQELSKLVDYDPDFWDFFKTRLYEDPTPRMARWGFEVGALTEEQVREIVHRYGYREADEEWFTQMLVGFQERAWVTKYLTALATAYINGAIDATELKKRVVETAGRNEAIADWIIKIADVRKEIKTKAPAGTIKLLSIGDLKQAFISGFVNEDMLRSKLLLMGYESGDVDILIKLLDMKRVTTEAGGAKVALSETQLLQAWRYGEITEDYLKTQLLLRGLAEDEVDDF